MIGGELHFPPLFGSTQRAGHDASVVNPVGQLGVNRALVLGESPDTIGFIKFEFSDIDVWIASAFFDLVGHCLGAVKIPRGYGDSSTFGGKCPGGFCAESTGGTRHYCGFTGQVDGFKYFICRGLLAEFRHCINLKEWGAGD